MAKKDYSEDLLIQGPTADLLEKQLDWQTVFAQDDEGFGPDSLLGRSNDAEVVLKREVLDALKRLNPGLPSEAYSQALAQVLLDDITKSLIALNQDKYLLLRDGVPVQYRDLPAGRWTNACAWLTSTTQTTTASWPCASCGCEAGCGCAAPT